MLDPSRYALDAQTVGFRKRMRQNVDWNSFNEALQTQTDSIKVRRELEETPINELHIMGAQRYGLEGNGKTNEQARQKRQMNGYVLRSFLATGGPVILPPKKNDSLLGIPSRFGQTQYTPNAVLGQQYTSRFTEPLNAPLDNNTILLGKAGIAAKSNSLSNPYAALQFQLNINASQQQINDLEAAHAEKKNEFRQFTRKMQRDQLNVPKKTQQMMSAMDQVNQMRAGPASRGRRESQRTPNQLQLENQPFNDPREERYIKETSQSSLQKLLQEQRLSSRYSSLTQFVEGLAPTTQYDPALEARQEDRPYWEEPDENAGVVDLRGAFERADAQKAEESLRNFSEPYPLGDIEDDLIFLAEEFRVDPAIVRWYYNQTGENYRETMLGIKDFVNQQRYNGTLNNIADESEIAIEFSNVIVNYADDEEANGNQLGFPQLDRLISGNFTPQIVVPGSLLVNNDTGVMQSLQTAGIGQTTAQMLDDAPFDSSLVSYEGTLTPPKKRSKKKKSATPLTVVNEDNRRAMEFEAMVAAENELQLKKQSQRTSPAAFPKPKGSRIKPGSSLTSI